ncbi:C25 family cysteine peptidase [Rufibacter sp. LB8]|nr:C25 family cysteine peptidase [Rufibacter sp. LB8]
MGQVSAQLQVFGNEWINYSQKYYKIKVPATGMYRLDRAYLQAAGISDVDPRNLQMFRRGKEISIHVAGESDGSFDAADYIEFYGEKNDGALDRELFKNPTADHINPYYSLYTDTAAYFLTWSATPGNRMEAYNQDPAGLTPSPWHWQEVMFFDNSQYTRGKRYGENYMSWMDAGEGYAGGSTAGFTFSLPGMISNPASTGPAPRVEIAMMGSNDNTHTVDIFVRTPADAERLIGTFDLEGYASDKKILPLEYTDFAADGRLRIRIAARNTASRVRTLYFKSIFAQRNTMAVAGLPFIQQEPSATPAYYVFEGASATAAVGYDISIPDQVKRVAGMVSGAQKGFVFPANFSKAVLWTSAHLIPEPANEVKFRSMVGNKSDYLIITHESLMKPGGGSQNPVRDYAAYRASTIGGGYDTLVIDVDQIYNQFFYGDKSSAALRRYMKFMMANGNPKYLFLLGKGLEADNVASRKNPSSLLVRDLVPTGGTPGSDVFFTSDWELGQYTPKVATGRIPANTPAEVMGYLNKVKVHEALPENLDWRKNILHLIGSTGAEQNTLLSYMRSYERIAESRWLGANVNSIIRNSSGGLENLNIAGELNAGLSLITFFGHSSGTVSDLDIGRVSDVVNGYNNTSKYPMLLMNGCNAGNIFTTGRTFGEDWLLTENKGAIAFLAHDNYGYPSLLNVFSSNFYTTAFGDQEYLSKPLGLQHQRTIELTEQKIGGANATAMNMQMVLQADPAIVVFGPEKADYTIPNGGVALESADGSKITANSEKFKVNIDIRNLGRVNETPFTVSISRKLENGTTITYDPVEFEPIYYRDTISIELEAKTTEGVGVNRFEVKVDGVDAIDEIDETNNTMTLEYFFSRSGVLAIGPQEFSIVKDNKVKLVGHSTDLLIGRRGYYFEIDTVHTFDSQWKKSTVVQADFMPAWEVTLPANTTQNDSVVYYWRFRYETLTPGEELVWASSSFRYMPGSTTGWSQKGIGQLQKAEKQRLEENTQKRTFEFTPTFRIFEVKGVGGGQPFGYPPYGIFLDNFKTIEADCNTNRPNMMAVVLNDKTLQPLDAPSAYASICGTPPKFVYHFNDLRQAANLTKLQQFLESVPAGYHIAMVGMSNVPYSTMSPGLKAAFNSIGSSLIDKLATGEPFAIIGRKGAAPGSVLEIGPSAEDPSPANMQTIRIEREVRSRAGQGTLVSNLIGPATKWNSLQHQVALLNQDDAYQLDVIGVSANNEEVDLFTDVKSSDLNLSSVNAATYPYLKLRLVLKDEAERTAPILKQWTILYDGAPEGVMRPDLVGLAKYSPEAISAQVNNGELDLQFAFSNVSGVDFTEELTVETILFQENGTRTEKIFKVRALEKDGTVFFNHKISTLQLQGNNRLRVTVNPRSLTDPAYKPLLEQNYLNNTMEIPFTVGTFTGLPPVIDVVFDGTRIIDGEIVSPRPMISMVLKDNMKKMPITDPSAMKVFLKKQGGEFSEINLTNNSAITFFPGNATTDFRVEYQPQLEDGIYTLEVQGTDAFGQKAGSENYSINFEVVNESAISNFYPYPNPFSSKTRFVFTLTGQTVPEKMKIQIMTLTGKVIREIQREELGAIKIGNNVSEFAWDGTDEFGDKLANGVYLYRVVMGNEQGEMKQRATAGDKAFKNGYGKIYILR